MEDDTEEIELHTPDDEVVPEEVVLQEPEGDTEEIEFHTPDDKVAVENVVPREPDAGNGDVPSDEKFEKRCKERDTMFFSKCAGKKRIDYVLVYGRDRAGDQRRKDFEEGLVEAGLQLEYEDIEDSSDGNAYFVKVHCPWDVLTKGAALLKLRKRIKQGAGDCFADSGFDCCEKFFQPDPAIMPPEVSEDYFTAVFNTERMDIFYMPDEESFFTNAERSLIAKFMLDRTDYMSLQENQSPEDKVRYGVESLIRKKVYTAAFPLHEGALIEESEVENPRDPSLFQGPDKDRQILYEVWAKPKNAFKWQPVDLIRKYFGEKIAIYFAWLGIYTTLLVPASIAGVIAFIYGIATMPSSITVKDICDASGPEFVMCPECDRLCDYGNLSDSCHYARFTRVFDNYATIAMAVFMSAWALCFTEIWKRQQAELQYDWDVADFEIEETVRPEFEVKIKTTRKNPITQTNEKYLTWYSYFWRHCTSIAILLFLVVVVLGALFAVIVYRLATVTALYGLENHTAKANARLIISVTASLINLIVCIIFSKVYEIIALKLTNMEAHRTHTSFEDSYTFKMIVFQFINFYGSIIYIAFFKGSFIDRPGSQEYYLFDRYREDQCDPSGCIVDVTIQLAIIMIGKQIANSAKQIIIPVICKCFRARDVKDKAIYMRWEQDNDLTCLGPLGLFQEYLSMVIQFGFVTIFVAAFPLAPLCALVNNIIELRLDAYKMVKYYQRMPALKAQDIGAWFSILNFFSFIAVLSNAFIIGWTSDLVPKMVYENTETDDGSLTGYVNASLSVFLTSDFTEEQQPDTTLFNRSYTTCRYVGYRYGPYAPTPYDYTPFYWRQLCARLTFIIVFEIVCILLIRLVMALIPDESGRVKRLRVYERELARKMAFDEKFDRSKQRRTALISRGSQLLDAAVAINMANKQHV